MNMANMVGLSQNVDQHRAARHAVFTKFSFYAKDISGTDYHSVAKRRINQKANRS